MACGPFRSYEELASHLPTVLNDQFERILAGDYGETYDATISNTTKLYNSLPELISKIYSIL